MEKRYDGLGVIALRRGVRLIHYIRPAAGLAALASEISNANGPRYGGDKATEALFQDEVMRQFRGTARPAKRKLGAVNAASRLEDLMVPPANRLEKLKGNLKDFYSIRINDQWRVIFRWIDGEPHDVQVVDYHG